ncbi:MAG: bifunctional enoyl-CoA hydratase/phosphate acetyltransferase [Oligoflexia bacterium]|nr:bifunctional enoyl-CoA hydratase/phosphate acetyltransferase [Oligoflexia bacterium]
MITNFDNLIKKLKNAAPKKMAIVSAEDEEVLLAIREAADHGICEAVLIGDENAINKIAKDHNISLKGFEIVNEPDQGRAALLGCDFVRSGRAGALMKGLLDTSKFMQAILNKERGLVNQSGGLLSHVAAFEIPTYNKLLLVTDAAINIAPDLNEKSKMIQNAVSIAKLLQIEKPLVAVCCAVEKVNPKMPATIDAAILSKMSERGQITGCIVDGPLALDNAINEESAKIKKINSPVAGRADIIMCNDIESANYLYKSLAFMANAKAGAIVAGASAPIVLTSRADSHNNKFLSIAMSMLTS